MKVEIKFGGFNELSRLLKQLPAAVENRVLGSATLKAVKAAKPAVVAATPRGKTPSKISAEHGPGHTNITVRRKRSRRKHTRASRIDTGNAPQLFWYEKGTRYQPARPFFARAFRSAEGLMIGILKAEISAGITREALRKGK